MSRYKHIDQKSLADLNKALKMLTQAQQAKAYEGIMKQELKPIEAMLKQITPKSRAVYGPYKYTTAEGKRKTKGRVAFGNIRKRYKASGPKIERGGTRGRKVGVKNGEGIVYHRQTSGNLRRSMGIRTPTKKYRTQPAEVWTGRKKGSRFDYDGWYDFFLEKGTIYQMPHPHMRNARRAAEKIMKGPISKQTEKYILRKAKALGFLVR